jgi:hypothetical protein
MLKKVSKRRRSLEGLRRMRSTVPRKAVPSYKSKAYTHIYTNIYMYIYICFLIHTNIYIYTSFFMGFNPVSR